MRDVIPCIYTGFWAVNSAIKRKLIVGPQCCDMRRVTTFWQVLEYIVKSYLCGKFNKVTELFDLHRSLVYSISKSVFLLDKLWLSYILSSANSWDQIGNVIVAYH